MGTDDLVARYVAPFYLDMMRLNATMIGPDTPRVLAGLASLATAEEVVRLLRGAWRERVMGAWLSLRQSDPSVAPEVLHALETSQGSLDAPPLATAAVVLAGQDAMDALSRYHAADVANEWGAAPVAAAAADHLARTYGMANPLPAPPNATAQAFAGLLAVAELVRR